MKYSNKEDFEKADVFGVGQPNGWMICTVFYWKLFFKNTYPARRMSCFPGKCNL